MTAGAEKAITHAHENASQYLGGYMELLRIPSVSTDPAYKVDLERCADWIVSEMTRIGFRRCRKIATDGQPVLYGEWLEAGDDRPTLLIYAHYDVQPVDPLELWESPPFEPTLRDGKLYARGAVDDKSGVWINLKALESIFAADGQLPVNVKLMFEGEEEMGSPNMLPFVQANKELLSADALIICDGGFNPDQPSVGYALRGIVSAEVRVSGPSHDLHSGGYGGAVHNPAHMVGKIIGSFHDDDGRVRIPGFYDRVRKLDQEELEAAEKAFEVTGKKWRAGAGTETFWAEAQGSIVQRATAWPTLDVNGMWSGYQGPGTKTVLPAKAGFKATMRLVADQDPYEIGRLFEDFVRAFACDTLDIDVKLLAFGWPVTMDRRSPAIETVQRAYEATLGERALLTRGGGSVPIAGMFQQELGLPQVSFGLGSGDGVHSPNEYINEAHFSLALDMAIRFYYFAAETL